MMAGFNRIILTALVGMTTMARAEEDFHFRLGHNVLLQTWTQSKVGGESYRESSLSTFKGGWELYAYGNNFNFYPGQEGSSMIFGFSFNTEMELGLGLGL